MGCPFRRPYQRLREYVEIIRQVVGGWRVRHEGEVLRLGGHAIEVTPLRDRIPIYVGALGPKAVRLTGEIADGWTPVLNAPEAMAGDFEALRAGAESAGRSVGDIVVAPDVLVLVTDRQAGGAGDDPRERWRARWAVGGAYFGARAARAGFPEGSGPHDRSVGKRGGATRPSRRSPTTWSTPSPLYGSREEILERD